ncbi:hypothetical protein [Jannaschia sp. LMIT008]|uniref:hypothetical protein n=1 Tax=Jannaschia maritima TaxID=3032585 RepID=UPI0028114FA6|nr:hypothetical protein [Jannaschia sp. LMIT008]
MLRLACLILALALPLAAPLPADAQARSIRLSAPFDPGVLTRSERRTLQAALALQGDYDALLDGLWGRGSRAALDSYAARTSRVRGATWRDVRSLMRAYDAEWDANDWGPVWHDAERVFHLRPDGLLDRQDLGDETRFVSPDGGLILVSRIDTRNPIDLHDAVAADAPRGTDPYRLSEDRRIVTAASMREGREVYMRSDFGGGVWMTHMVLADAANEGRMGLIASSFARERIGPLDPRSGPVLGALLRGASNLPGPEVAEAPRPQPGGGDPLDRVLGLVLDRALDRLLDDEPEPEPQQPRPQATDPLPRPDLTPQIRAASGFFVNTTDIVTTDAIADLCRRVALADGTRLQPVATDRRAGVAVYAAPGRSGDWLALAGDTPTRDDTLYAAARPPRAAETQILRGRADGTYDGGRRIAHDLGAPRRGEAGAPLIVRDDVVAGVWTRDRTGDALSATGLAEVLTRERVPYMAADTRGRGTRVGVTGQARRAVVTLMCEDR